MGWSVGHDDRWDRDIGYGVPSICDHPDCNEPIDRGLGYVCGGEPYGGKYGCGLFFCGKHLHPTMCERCLNGKPPFNPKPDTKEWIEWKLTDPSWELWRDSNQEEVETLRRRQ
jgi:hypothetical protein